MDMQARIISQICRVFLSAVSTPMLEPIEITYSKRRHENKYMMAMDVNVFFHIECNFKTNFPDVFKMSLNFQISTIHSSTHVLKVGV